jgi:hypothetical protein
MRLPLWAGSEKVSGGLTFLVRCHALKEDGIFETMKAGKFSVDKRG